MNEKLEATLWFGALVLVWVVFTAIAWFIDSVLIHLL